MRHWLQSLAALLVLLGVSTPATAGLLFSDDFEAQSVGDNGPQLLHWTGTGLSIDPNFLTIASENGNKFLHVDASLTPPFFRSKNPRTVQPFLEGNVLSTVFDARIGDSPVGGFTFALGGSNAAFQPIGAYAIRTGNLNNRVLLIRNDGSVGSVLGTVGFAPGTEFHTYELRSTLNANSIDFDVFADCALLFSVTDNTPLFDPTTRIQFQWEFSPRFVDHVVDGVQVDIDNFRATATPEPSSLLLLGMGALGVFGYGRRKQRRNPATSPQL